MKENLLKSNVENKEN